MELTARLHLEEGAYWAEVVELPGCFASGQTLDELTAALTEAIFLCLDEERGAIKIGGAPPSGDAPAARVEELKIAVPT